MRITSPLFANNQYVPVNHTCKGPNTNPPLEFHEIPAGTKSLVLMIEDVDAPSKPWVHWLVFNIPPTSTRCERGQIPDGSTEGLCNGGTFGYEGPCPKYFQGTHHYLFRLYALDTLLDLPAESDRKAILPAMESHILGEAQLIGLADGEAAAAA
jgi:Raf kinase inhibitor-like YbhB/YbcL family protein